ncbi:MULTISPECIES: MogA/MoaB family molybdenum cofactor biosynthesis protein [unclassified Pseudodesulfovibrio]|uniref:MogA/MoaB family molybdenum cofactor biosynthesis protein n=1 Tax=unclassified Pseudodesulfovibrio TaxID=2661612 RepID=UPI000FEB9F65|nr:MULTISPECIES: MogA/MoaB family molybdenum cofactor biosynthesis protein [unclassified Pseudodesulfovibrio]MCJ2164101.1 MogA/MoaB family molybdenum cofactor biosynthesis protein [Pseudodesulfovibrio sp. S3-i]RWU05267.1 MogA/MoaB family molybdenum cofactor biosynthesis protein [Pseudodesulfovibrio sp. S3]
MSDITVRYQLTAAVNKGDRLSLCASSDDLPVGSILTADVRPGLRVGERLSCESGAFLVQSAGWWPGGAGAASRPVYLVEALQDMKPGSGVFTISRTGATLAWITLSDKGSQGKRVDESGPLVGELVGKTLDLAFVQGFVIPDETDRLKGLLVDLALNQGFDLILTTGGTGVAPRDITPEATLAVIEKRLPGFERAMTAASLSKTPHGAISRAVAGTLAHTLIVNMPGSPKAVAECLEPLLPTLRHTLEKLQGDPSDCAALRNE